MSPIPLQLDGYFVESLTYQARRDFDPKSPAREAVTPSAEGPFLREGDARRFMTRLRVTVGRRESSNSRCELELSLVGFFSLAENLKPKLRAAMLTQNAPSILYGVARQIVAETTGNGPWGRVLLPTADFVRPAAKPRRRRGRADSPVAADRTSRARR